MKRSKNAPSLTSLPQAPQEEAQHRVRQYVITMTIRVVCFVLMVVVTPYSWYTVVFGLGAVFLPYFAVVIANAGADSSETPIESPELMLDAGTSAPETTAQPPIITVQESSRSDRTDGSA
ncbi:DUF3099 domain-containing protein [Microbacterium sp. YY-01]|uniref:DUF3099 domain-containing protein n=1 Tax=Microbacterium sp. YY-01 TaxID=3421634 RepID=UPI003D16CCBE